MNTHVPAFPAIAEIPQEPVAIAVQSVMVITQTGPHARSHASVVATIDGHEHTLAWEGRDAGPIDAICHAFRAVVPDFTWLDYRSKALSEGENAAGEVMVMVKKDGNTFNGIGRDTNTLHATAVAVADALHKIRWLEYKKKKK